MVGGGKRKYKLIRQGKIINQLVKINLNNKVPLNAYMYAAFKSLCIYRVRAPDINENTWSRLSRNSDPLYCSVLTILYLRQLQGFWMR